MSQKDDHFHFGLYELKKYLDAEQTLNLLKKERDEVVKMLYDDISPTITTVDYDTGRWYSKSTRTEPMALKIIDEKEKYQALIDKEERKLKLFRLGLESLTDRERDAIQVYYFDRKNDLGLSDFYFNQILNEAQNKLCIFLEQEKGKSLENNNKTHLKELAQRISRWNAS